MYIYNIYVKQCNSKIVIRYPCDHDCNNIELYKCCTHNPARAHRDSWLWASNINTIVQMSSTSGR